MVDRLKQRQISANKRRESLKVFHPWGNGSGNPSYSGKNKRRKFLKNLNGSASKQRLPIRSGLLK